MSSKIVFDEEVAADELRVYVASGSEVQTTDRVRSALEELSEALAEAETEVAGFSLPAPVNTAEGLFGIKLGPIVISGGGGCHCKKGVLIESDDDDFMAQGL